MLDENLARFAPSGHQGDLELLTNRFDIYRDMKAAGWRIRFSDFDFTPWQGAELERLYYRVSKEKPVVHHVINQALGCLQAGAELVLVGAKNEGTKTYFDKARALYACGQLHKAGKGAFSAVLTAPAALPRASPSSQLPSHSPSEPSSSAEPAWLDDRDYRQLRQITAIDGQPVLSKPGVFGWDKVDAGSALLADRLPEVYRRLASSTPRVLDLGCGYGYLSLRVWAQGAGEITATDNNAAAISSCRENFRRFAVVGQVVADDCAASLDGSFDLVVCNPPFHQGFSVAGSLTDQFLASARRLLSSRGQAVFVVNRFIPLERKAQALFAEVETFADNGSFKLVRLARPR